MTPVSRRKALLAMGAASLSRPALAQSFPARPVQLVVPFGAGGGTDILARHFAAAAARMGVSMLVVPMGGQGGARGTRYVLQSAADGYTLLFGTMGSNVLTPMLNDIGFQPDSFEPVAIVAATTHVFCVAGDSAIQSMADLLREAQKGQLSYASAGAGSVGHVVMEVLSRKTRLEFLHIPYSGSAEALNAVLGHHVNLTLPTTGSALPSIRSGQIRALAVTAEARSPQAPEIPTTRELGVDVLCANWRGILAPKGIPVPAREFLTDLSQRISNEPEFVRQATLAEGEPPVFRDAAAFANQIQNEMNEYREITVALRTPTSGGPR
jgi:tripartite-type tricarboxylate transporter receptor subunit TctC